MVIKNIIIESKRTEIQRIEKILEEINSEFKLEEEKLVNYQIAISEALVNAIIHGNKEANEKRVFVTFTFDENRLTAKIKDEGTGFDPESIPDPTNDDNLLKEHGRGLFIMKSLTDEFECKSSEKGTEYTLTIFKNKK